MSTITDATEMPRRIWIEPECCAGGDVTDQRWADDDIFDCDEGAGATEYVRADLVADILEALKEVREALDPFADTAEWDIADIEADSDRFRQMDPRAAVAGIVTVGHFRKAHEARARLDYALEDLEGDDDG